MRILITGGAGFIGSHIQDRLIKLKHQVAIVDSLRSGRKENLHPKAEFFKVDVRDKVKLTKVFKTFNPEAVFHLAAQNEVPYSMDHPEEDADINIMGMINLLELCKEYQVKKFVYSNTGGAYYGDMPENKLPVKEDEEVLKPSSFYGVSKAAAESYLRLYGNLYQLPWVSLRYSNVYGPRQSGNREAGVVSIFTYKLLHGEQPTINGKGNHTRDYVYVGDVVEANIKALNYRKSDFFNIATSKRISNNEVFAIISHKLKSKVKPIKGPARAGDTLHNSLSNKKAAKLLGWKPKINFKKGIELTIQYYTTRI